MADSLSGVIERVVFHNPENGFAVLRVQAAGRRDLVTVVGCLAGSTWCDVSWANYRRWMSANFIYTQIAGQPVVVTQVYRRMPVISSWADARRDARVQYRVNRRWDRWLGE